MHGDRRHAEAAVGALEKERESSKLAEAAAKAAAAQQLASAEANARLLQAEMDSRDASNAARHAELEAEARAALVQLLEDDGCRTVALEDPQTVVTAANEQRPDLIILSATAADPDLCRLVKASEPTLGFTPVILLTDRENVDARLAALRSGADD